MSHLGCPAVCFNCIILYTVFVIIDVHITHIYNIYKSYWLERVIIQSSCDHELDHC